ncbi:MULTISPECIES: protein kinase [Halobacterium]|uniref:protein kinase n=1 Tax=Halobacterium TaxID=2239 RepID=UPI00073F96B2|nr:MULTISPECIES: protein kinase [Halobacterium]MCG1002911.1 protein kinase [Halobacterium noricense]
MDRHTDGSVDEERIAALRRSVDADGVEELAARLHSDDADERAGAAWRLVDAVTTDPTGVRAVLDDVRGAVEDDDVWVRRGATWVLAELAERQPDALSVQFSDLVSLTRASDPLVQQNAVVAVAGVTKSYPARASSGLSAIAALTQSENALVKRYAEQAVEEVTAAIAARAEDAGYPVVVRSHPAYADLFPDGVSVVETGGDDDRSQPIHVSFGQNAPVHSEEREGEETEAGRPKEIPDPPEVTLAADDVSPNMKLRAGVLTTDYRADVDEDVLEHGLATVRRLHADESEVTSAFADAVEQWAGVDDHDHVVAVLGHGPRWLATRYDDGDTLEGRGAPATLAEAVWDASVLTRAVSHAHSRGVVHGGVHPGAVRFVATGPRTWDAPLLGDWGFAHAASARQTPPIPGAFAAPEHRDPETYGRFDQATDVYGLGALAYFLLTGEPPGSRDTRIPASERNPALPEEADDLFARALAPEKRARFATVLDFQRAFDDLAAGIDGVQR